MTPNPTEEQTSSYEDSRARSQLIQEAGDWFRSQEPFPEDSPWSSEEDLEQAQRWIAAAYQAGMEAGRKAPTPRHRVIESLETEVQAGKELYWAIQDGLEHCPWCGRYSLRHTTECPVSKYLMVTSPAYREALDG